MIKIKRAYRLPRRKTASGFGGTPLAPGSEQADLALDLWLKEATPSPQLRKWFCHDPKKWEKFCRRYWDELADKDEALKLLREKDREGNLTLVYGSRDENQTLRWP